MDVTEEMLQREKDETRKRIDMVAMERINAIKMPIMVMGRTNDNNMPVFRLSYELARSGQASRVEDILTPGARLHLRSSE